MDIFISYRRTGGEWLAYSVYLELTLSGYDVFFDKDSLPGGDYEKYILKQVEECIDYILILPPNALDRCFNEDDLLYKEIKTAIQYKKNIIPIIMDEFSWEEFYEFQHNNNPEVFNNLIQLKKNNDCEPKGIMDIDGTILRLKKNLLKSAPKETVITFEHRDVEGRLFSNIIPAEYFVEHSRDRELAWISNELEKTKIAYIWGIGGIGKTEIALQYAAKCKKCKNIYFTKFKDSIKNTIINMQFSDYNMPSLDGLANETREKLENKIYAEKLDLLNKHTTDDVLIIDNVDAPDKTLSDIRNEKEFADLMGTNLKFIFTTRSCPDNHTPEVLCMNREYILSLMKYYIQKDIDENILIELADIVGCHTLAVELIAKGIGDDFEPFDEKELLMVLKSSGVAKINGVEVETNKDRQYKSASVYGHLKKLFDMSSFSACDINVMKKMLMLSQQGMDVDSIMSSFLMSDEKVSFKRLVKKGWISLNSKRIASVHPLIRSIGLEEYTISDVECQKYINDLYNQSFINLRSDVYSCFSNSSLSKESKEKEFNNTLLKVKMLAESFANIYEINPSNNLLAASAAAEAFDYCMDFERATIFSHYVLDDIIRNIDDFDVPYQMAFFSMMNLWCPQLEESSWDPDMSYGNELLEDHSQKSKNVQDIYSKISMILIRRNSM